MNNAACSTIRRAIVRSLAVAGLALAASVQAQTVMPPVTVTAPTTGGGTVICSGNGCAMMLQMMQSQAYYELHDQMPPLGEESNTPIDRNTFCGNLRSQKPEGCGASPPPAPLVNISFDAFANSFGNGCGDGSWAGDIADLIAGTLVDHYSGDPNRPMSGINFTGACNVHDACYAGQGDRGGCDGGFYTQLSGVCSAQSGEVRDICNGFAHAYSAAVSLGGQDAYDQAGQAYQCALWHDNMDDNSCPR
ncbi:MAG TPA: hypothetical protein VLF18_07130 [Tahibacter sp.]|uniref:hypothetical protein n=1 Tax=Tahibacter sp. TaxID=2056211 RepID=UPI002B634AF8|nr:hypothetical protein [Tahibacter sp.]HSX59955.1 hypothetical protein [Tahibacter sp.]